jgi:hypothetical protein
MRFSIRKELFFYKKNKAKREQCTLAGRRKQGPPTDEFHDHDVLPENERRGARNARGVDAGEVAVFLLGPRRDHLARVRLGVAAPEPVVPGNVPVTVLEDCLFILLKK